MKTSHDKRSIQMIRNENSTLIKAKYNIVVYKKVALGISESLESSATSFYNQKNICFANFYSLEKRLY